MRKKRESKLISSYPSSKKGGIFAVALFLALILFLIYSMINLTNDVQNQDGGLASAVFLALILFFSIFLYYAVSNAYRSRLNIYEEGIELERASAKLFSEWENLDHFGKYDDDNQHQYGIFFAEKRPPIIANILDKLLYRKPDNFINLLPFVTSSKGSIRPDALRKTALGQQLFELAPQLFD